MKMLSYTDGDADGGAKCVERICSYRASWTPTKVPWISVSHTGHTFLSSERKVSSNSNIADDAATSSVASFADDDVDAADVIRSKASFADRGGGDAECI